MAPQQNSTFIENDSILRSKFHKNPGMKYDNDEEEEEIIKRYSPILPPMNAQLNEPIRRDYKEKPKQKTKLNELHEVPQKINQNFYKRYRNGNGNGNGNVCYANHATQSCLSRRSRSVSVHGINSTMEQGQKEITIWIDNEPRYVSGVTKKTTCRDIIKALIDDEIQNGNYAFIKNSEKQFIETKDGGDGVCATSRDYSDYVITESWRGIERSYDGNMTILPVWKAWSRVHNELRLRLRHQSEIRDPIQYTKPRQHQSILRKYLSKLTRLWKKEKPDNANRPFKCVEMKENCLLPNQADIPDEFLFVILPDKVYEKERQTLQPIPEQSSTSPSSKHHKRNRSKRPDRKSSANRKKHERGGINGVSAINNCIRRRQLSTSRTSLRNSVRYRLAQKTSEMDVLYAREYALTRELSEKCKLYRLQNQIYSNPDQQWNISIGQVQRKIENYAKEIVRTEHELLELKNEIKQDISLINNLKRMTLERKSHDEQKFQKPLSTLSPKPPSLGAKNVQTIESNVNREMQFVDNIYEFCDNNASMLV